MPDQFPLDIFYDGSCRVCSREMAAYRGNNPRRRLRFIDISDPGFNARDFGRTHEDFMARLHVRDATGRFYTGVDAFDQIWQAYPSGSFYRLLAFVVGFPGVNLLSRGGYSLFARYRHLLPGKNAACDDGSCRISKPIDSGLGNGKNKPGEN